MASSSLPCSKKTPKNQKYQFDIISPQGFADLVGFSL